MAESAHLQEWKSIIWAIRFYALIIIGVLVVSDLTPWLAEDTVKLITMLMALLTITSSFQPYLAEHRRLGMWIMAGLIVLLLLGTIVFFLVMVTL